MKKLFYKIIVTMIFFVIVVITAINYYSVNSVVEASGDLSIDWGASQHKSALFHIENMAPGDSISKQVTVYNDAGIERAIGVRGIKKNENKALSQVLTIQIESAGKVLYGKQNESKTMEQFFIETNGSEPVSLSTIPPGKKKNYIFTVRFEPNAGNQFQSARLIFDLQIGIHTKIPIQCQDLNITNKPIYGTKRADRLIGTNGNDLIIGFEGSDIIDGKGGDDCIIGSGGNDIIYGGHGNDYVEGNDGNDLVLGQSGQDTISGGNGWDILIGGTGRDRVIGGHGVDICQGESKSGCEL